jgi:SnoaL-like domain
VTTGPAAPGAADIAHLHAAYSYSHDHAEIDEFTALFAEDAVFTIGGVEEVKGRDAIAEFARRSARSGVHSSGAILIRPDGTARTPFVFVNATSDRVSGGYYHDTFTRSASGALLFSHRYVELSPVAE